MLDFLLSLFNIWVWFPGGLLIILLLCRAYSYGPCDYYAPYVDNHSGDWIKSVYGKGEFKHIKFERIYGEWHPKINLRKYYLKEAMFGTIVIFSVMLSLSYKVNHSDISIQEINVQIEKLFTPRVNK